MDDTKDNDSFGIEFVIDDVAIDGKTAKTWEKLVAHPANLRTPGQVLAFLIDLVEKAKARRRIVLQDVLSDLDEVCFRLACPNRPRHQSGFLCFDSNRSRPLAL